MASPSPRTRPALPPMQFKRTPRDRRMLLVLLLPFLLVSPSSTRHAHITLRENITQPCPGLRSDLVDKSSIQMSFDMISGGAGEDEVTVSDLSGTSRRVSFPGCYRVRMSFRVARPLKNPYVEAFLQLGTNIPCQSAKKTLAGNICANVTNPANWCPSSTNEKLRGFLKGKQTCQFCNLCGSLDRPDVLAEGGQFVENEGSNTCDTEADRQRIQFKMCTPTRKEMRERHPEYEEKMDEYWQYLKQGVLTAVIHVLDREELAESKMTQCRTLCKTYEGKRGVSDSYKATLLKSIDKLCSPKDEYAACVYHTLKFDLSTDF